ncbi:MAG: hypothetical protein HYZ44_13780 [Bacteroidetes bacterium]|nr:hypothetical protein [Bacteroidota bacterium]
MTGHIQFYILGLISIINWGQKSVEIQFDSSDNVTAGFSEISLQLHSDRKVNLVFGESVGVGQNEAGGIYKWETNTVHGKWRVKGNLIYVSIDSTKEFIKRTFEFKQFRALGQRLTTEDILVFPVNADSVIINDIPCLRIKMKEKK